VSDAERAAAVSNRRLFAGARNEADRGADELEEERERTAAKRRKVKLEARKVST
jgi:hypothetical protein